MNKKTRQHIKNYTKRFIACLLLLLNTLTSCRWQVGECGLGEHSCAFPGTPGHGRYVDVGQQRANASGMREKGEEKTPEKERIDEIDRNLKLYYHNKLEGLITVAKESGFVPSELKHIHECVVYNLQELDKLGFSSDLTSKCKSLVKESESILNLDLAFFTQTPTLHEAALAGDLALVQSLVANGTSVQLTTPANETALHYVAMAESPNIALAAWLLEQHITKDVINDNGNTALSLAVERGHVDLVRLLMESGASLAFNHEHNWTLLHLATYHGHLPLVQYFLEEAEIPITTAKQFKTPLDIAIERKHTDIEAYLRAFLLKAFRANEEPMRKQLMDHLAEEPQQAALQQLQEGLRLPPHAITPETLANQAILGIQTFLQGTNPLGLSSASGSSGSGDPKPNNAKQSEADDLAKQILDEYEKKKDLLSPEQKEELQHITVEDLRPHTAKLVEALEELRQLEEDEIPAEIDSESDEKPSIQPREEKTDGLLKEENNLPPLKEYPHTPPIGRQYIIPTTHAFVPKYRIGNVTRLKQNFQELQEDLRENLDSKLSLTQLDVIYKIY